MEDILEESRGADEIEEEEEWGEGWTKRKDAGECQCQSPVIYFGESSAWYSRSTQDERSNRCQSISHA